MGKIILILIIALSFSVTAYAQKNVIPADSNINALKIYLSKNVRYPAVEIESYVEGTMALTIHLNKNKMIDSIYFERHLDEEFDAEIVKKLKSYPSPLMLPGSSYTIGLQFFILEDGKPDSVISPFNPAAYKNFLFELTVTGVIAKRKTTIVY